MKHVALLVAFICSLASAFGQKNGYKIIKTFHIQSPGGWDYLAVNGDNLYVSHGTQVNILNKKTGDSVGVIKNTLGVHGIAFVESLHRGYISNGRMNNVLVFDYLTNDTLTRIATGENPDAIIFEEYSKMIITCNGRSKSLSVIDPKANKVIATIALGGKSEMPASNGAGRLYVNLEDKSEIAEVDMRTYKVLSKWSLEKGKEPTGLAFDKKTNRLFAGCNKLFVVLNAGTGKVVTTLPIGDGCDGVVFDSSSQNIFASCGEGTLAVIHENSADEYKTIANVTTKRGARTIALDKSTHLLYLPTAEFEAVPTDAPKRTRPQMKSDTFQVLVLGKA